MPPFDLTQLSLPISYLIKTLKELKSFHYPKENKDASFEEVVDIAMEGIKGREEARADAKGDKGLEDLVRDKVGNKTPLCLSL